MEGSRIARVSRKGGMSSLPASLSPVLVLTSVLSPILTLLLPLPKLKLISWVFCFPWPQRQWLVHVVTCSDPGPMHPAHYFWTCVTSCPGGTSSSATSGVAPSPRGEFRMKSWAWSSMPRSQHLEVKMGDWELLCFLVFAFPLFREYYVDFCNQSHVDKTLCL